MISRKHGIKKIYFLWKHFSPEIQSKSFALKNWLFCLHLMKSFLEGTKQAIENSVSEYI
jgi:hypothetical protein